MGRIRAVNPSVLRSLKAVSAPQRERSRRLFLQFLAASPLLAGAAWAQTLNQLPTLKLSAAEEAITLMDFEEAARRVLPPAHWGYMASSP